MILQLQIFDNGRYRNWSRIIELDPIKMKIVWEYKAEGFFSGAINEKIIYTHKTEVTSLSFSGDNPPLNEYYIDYPILVSMGGEMTPDDVVFNTELSGKNKIFLS